MATNRPQKHLATKHANAPQKEEGRETNNGKQPDTTNSNRSDRAEDNMGLRSAMQQQQWHFPTKSKIRIQTITCGAEEYKERSKIVET